MGQQKCGVGDKALISTANEKLWGSSMKSKRNLIISIFQLVIGFLSIAAFVVVGLSGENTTKWIITLILAITYVVLGVIGIIDYRSNK